MSTVTWLKALRGGKGKAKCEASLQFPLDEQDKLQTTAEGDLFGELGQLLSQRQSGGDLVY